VDFGVEGDVARSLSGLPNVYNQIIIQLYINPSFCSIVQVRALSKALIMKLRRLRLTQQCIILQTSEGTMGFE
jgi:hypothetical protein